MRYPVKTCDENAMKPAGKNETFAALGLSGVSALAAGLERPRNRRPVRKRKSQSTQDLRRGCGFIAGPKDAGKEIGLATKGGANVLVLQRLAPSAPASPSRRSRRKQRRHHGTNAKRKRGQLLVRPSLALFDVARFGPLSTQLVARQRVRSLQEARRFEPVPRHQNPDFT